ncbi:MAG TPA: hypothetical protein VHG93_05985 [Longimicrobium sp.]|nr:hypothetical protein [Longimicrobium sp.]
MITRARRGPDPFLDWKVRIFFAGAVLLGVGVATGRDVLVLIAILVLAIGALTIAILDRRRRKAEPAEEDEVVEEDEPEEEPTR